MTSSTLLVAVFIFYKERLTFHRSYFFNHLKEIEKCECRFFLFDDWIYYQEKFRVFIDFAFPFISEIIQVYSGQYMHLSGIIWIIIRLSIQSNLHWYKPRNNVNTCSMFLLHQTSVKNCTLKSLTSIILC